MFHFKIQRNFQNPKKMHAFIILWYALGFPRAFVLTSTKETSAREPNASPLKPRLLVLDSMSPMRPSLDVAVHTPHKTSLSTSLLTNGIHKSKLSKLNGMCTCTYNYICVHKKIDTSQ